MHQAQRLSSAWGELTCAGADAGLPTAMDAELPCISCYSGLERWRLRQFTAATCFRQQLVRSTKGPQHALIHGLGRCPFAAPVRGERQ